MKDNTMLWLVAAGVAALVFWPKKAGASPGQAPSSTPPTEPDLLCPQPHVPVGRWSVGDRVELQVFNGEPSIFGTLCGTTPRRVIATITAIYGGGHIMEYSIVESDSPDFPVGWGTRNWNGGIGNAISENDIRARA